MRNAINNMRMKISAQPASRMMRATLRAAEVSMTKRVRRARIADRFRKRGEVLHRWENVLDELHDHRADETRNRGEESEDLCEQVGLCHGVPPGGEYTPAAAGGKVLPGAFLLV